MTVVARRIVSVPVRTATQTWEVISQLLAPDMGSVAARELASVTGIACSLIAREALTSPIVVYGSGPRVRVYCLYNQEAIEGDNASESALSFDTTTGDWNLSLPCPEDDLPWVKKALGAISRRISARDMTVEVDDGDGKLGPAKALDSEVDMEAFFKL